HVDCVLAGEWCLPAKTEWPPPFLFQPGNGFIGDFLSGVAPVTIGEDLRGRWKYSENERGQGHDGHRAEPYPCWFVHFTPPHFFGLIESRGNCVSDPIASFDLSIQLSTAHSSSDLIDNEQRAAVFNEFGVFCPDLHDAAGNLGVDRREELHDFDEAKRLAWANHAADLDEGWRFGGGRTVESSHHRSGHLDLARGR